MIQVTEEDASSGSFENLPAHKARKSLRAGKIISITHSLNVDVTVCVGNGSTHTYSMSGNWAARHHPKVGGYVVVVGDRYMSYMAAADFEGADMNIEKVHEAALKLDRLANLYHSANRQVAVDDKTPDEIEGAMISLYEALPDQPTIKE